MSDKVNIFRHIHSEDAPYKIRSRLCIVLSMGFSKALAQELRNEQDQERTVEAEVFRFSAFRKPMKKNVTMIIRADGRMRKPPLLPLLNPACHTVSLVTLTFNPTFAKHEHIPMVQA